MASDVMSLFNMPTQEQLGQQYLSGLMASPAQIGSQGLLQQVVSLGGNAGAGLGYGVGRLMGGMTADEVRAKSIDDAMRTVQGKGLTSDADMYGALSQELARRGLTQDALMARNAGLKAMQTEEQIRLDRQRGDIALSELGLRQTKAAQEAELFPLELEAKREAIAKIKQDQLVLEEQLAAALNSGNKERAAGIQRQLDAKRAEADIEQRKIRVLERNAASTEVSSQASLLRAGQEKLQGAIGAIPYTDLTGKLTMVPVGRGVGNKIIGSGTNKSYTLEEWQSGGAFVEEDALKKKLKIQEEDTGGGDKNKNKGNVPSLAEIANRGQTSTVPQAAQPTQTVQANSDLEAAFNREYQEMVEGQRMNFSPEVGRYFQQKRAQQRAIEEQQYLERERQRQLRGQR